MNLDPGIKRQELLKRIVTAIDDLAKDYIWVIADHSTDLNLDLELSFDYSYEGCAALEKLVMHLDQWEYVYVYNFGFSGHDGIDLRPYWEGSLRLRFFHENVTDEMLEGLVSEFEKQGE